MMGMDDAALSVTDARHGSSGGDSAYLGESALGEDTDVKLAISIDKNQKHCIARAVSRDVGRTSGDRPSMAASRFAGGDNSHQQTGFTAGTVADDDEFSADLGHGI